MHVQIGLYVQRWYYRLSIARRAMCQYVYIHGKHLYFYVYQVGFTCTMMEHRSPSCIYDNGIIDHLSLSRDRRLSSIELRTRLGD